MKIALLLAALCLLLASQAFTFQRLLVDAPDSEEGLWWAAQDIAVLSSLPPEAVTPFQGELDANVFNQPNETARQAIDAVLPQLDQILADNAQ